MLLDITLIWMPRALFATCQYQRYVWWEYREGFLYWKVVLVFGHQGRPLSWMNYWWWCWVAYCIWYLMNYIVNRLEHHPICLQLLKPLRLQAWLFSILWTLYQVKGMSFMNQWLNAFNGSFSYFFFWTNIFVIYTNDSDLTTRI